MLFPEISHITSHLSETVGVDRACHALSLHVSKLCPASVTLECSCAVVISHAVGMQKQGMPAMLVCLLTMKVVTSREPQDSHKMPACLPSELHL